MKVLLRLKSSIEVAPDAMVKNYFDEIRIMMRNGAIRKVADHHYSDIQVCMKYLCMSLEVLMYVIALNRKKWQLVKNQDSMDPTSIMIN